MFSWNKANRIVNSLLCDLKKVKKWKPVLYTPIYMILNFFWSFFFSERTYPKIENEREGKK